MDSIEIQGIRCYGYTGYLPEEKILGQWFEVNLSLSLDLKISGISDSIEDTLNYCNVINIVKDEITSANFSLIEKLAETIAQKILFLPKVHEVRVNLSKLSPPIPNFKGKVTVDITRKHI
ncbi:MAG: dihydroneopterin aldolase [Candidatus Atelocyanobacterium thalassa]|uniref:7,8-dihydroneopterin aldolase n=1 Tax=Candidatus Atelocyanobacterium thalassa isolate SIO64986 TaxID=1527444 RepID=A0A086CIE5_9CHRO|nr:MAG: dihydroneopterin aldolase [Candidatus Atelocyanobacterium thalassa isolate SIO64986]